MAGNNPLEMSDEEFLSKNGPPEVEEDGSNPDTDQNQEEEEHSEEEGGSEGNEDTEEENSEGDESQGAEPKDGEDEEESEEGDPADSEADKQEKPSEGESSAEGDKPKEDKKEKADTEAEVKEASAEEALSFYQKITAPFKANGKTIQVKNADEALTLMQMGANYTKKMQDIRPHRNVLMMLDKNGLMDPGKLSFLIDVSKKDPAAIKKLVKDAGIDPMDIDPDAPSDYQAGDHSVSDEEAALQETLNELHASPTGQETVRIIDKTWDPASKDALWKHPEIMTTINEQRENGIYEAITTEMDRRITLGQIKPGTPFLEAYTMIGDEFAAEAKKAQPDQAGQPEARQQKEPLARKTVAPKPTVSNGDKVGAAATSRSGPKKSHQVVNPLDLSDEEFLKMNNLENII